VYGSRNKEVTSEKKSGVPDIQLMDLEQEED